MITIPKPKRGSKPDHICQFLIVLPNTDPLVWRRIQVPEGYSFWDLHVAIQDAMGWKDYHLHEFVVMDSKTGRLKRIGIADDDMPDEQPCLARWKVPIAQYLTYGTDPVRYRYDFGDDWEHTLEFEEIVADDGGAYPRCAAGAGACPPEDVGGTHGYVEFLQVIRNRRHPEHDAMLERAGGSFDPHAFDPKSVTFDNPRGPLEDCLRTSGKGCLTSTWSRRFSRSVRRCRREARLISHVRPTISILSTLTHGRTSKAS